jgi:hypothetical protein
MHAVRGLLVGMWTAAWLSRCTAIARLPASEQPPLHASQQSVSSTMIATSPPEASPTYGDWTLYTNAALQFELRVPPGSAITTNEDGSGRIDLPVIPGTNLGEKFLHFARAVGVNPCIDPIALDVVRFNGIEFEVVQTEPVAAMGNIYEHTRYSTGEDADCLVLTFFLHSYPPERFQPPPPEFDRGAETAVFEQVLSTFAWLQTPPQGTAVGTAIETPPPAARLIDETPGVTSPPPGLVYEDLASYQI